MKRIYHWPLLLGFVGEGSKFGEVK